MVDYVSNVTPSLCNPSKAFIPLRNPENRDFQTQNVTFPFNSLIPHKIISPLSLVVPAAVLLLYPYRRNVPFPWLLYSFSIPVSKLPIVCNMFNPRKSSESREESENQPSSPILPEETSSNLCPWPRKRKASARMSMYEFEISADGYEDHYAGSAFFFNQDERGRPTTSLPTKPIYPATQKKRKIEADALYQTLNPEELEHAEELNSRLRALLTELEHELRSFSIREAICKKPTVCMHPPKKSKLMQKRSLGF